MIYDAETNPPEKSMPCMVLLPKNQNAKGSEDTWVMRKFNAETQTWEKGCKPSKWTTYPPPQEMMAAEAN